MKRNFPYPIESQRFPNLMFLVSAQRSTSTVTRASHHNSPHLPWCTIYGLYADQDLEKVYADKGYFGEPNRDFLNLNKIEDGIMRKDTTASKLTDYEKE